MKVERNTAIEDLVGEVPGAVKYLFKQGIVCIKCGEPIWGTLEEAAREKGFGDDDIDRFVKDLNTPE
jgi:methionine synthase II (cobalamin-independent)